jgi:hypothetical protein
MAAKLNNLFFVKFIDRTDYDRIVFCLTAKDATEAESKGRAMIADAYRDRYALDACEVICKTRDVVDCFEPV